jgi:hypothetical protein
VISVWLSMPGAVVLRLAQSRIAVMDVPPTRYTKTTDGVHVAYQVCGRSLHDLVLVNSAYSSNMEVCWEWDALADGFRWSPIGAGS